MQNIIELFPTQIYKKKLSIDNVKIYKCIKKLEREYKALAKETNHGAMVNSLTYTNALPTINTLPDMQELVEKATEHAKIFWNELGYSKTPFNGRMDIMWFNTFKKGGYVGMHNHSPAPLVGAYYLNKTDSGSNLNFLNPNEMLLKTQPFGHKGYDEFTFFEKEIEVYSGDLVLFPGYLKHRSSPVSDNSKRITIAFNFML